MTRSRSPAGNRKAAAREARVVSHRGGRPSKAKAEKLAHRIVDTATELFFELGYGATTIEAVAQRARMAKRTIYDRFENKAALFSAVVHCTIERLRPRADVPLLQGVNLAEILRGLAILILRAALSPSAIALHRLIIAEASRFPDLAMVVNKQGGSDEATWLIADALDREARMGNLTLDDSTFAAQQFLHMVIALPQRRALGLGIPMTSTEIDAWAGDVVNLFLNGCRGWEPAAKS